MKLKLIRKHRQGGNPYNFGDAVNVQRTASPVEEKGKRIVSQVKSNTQSRMNSRNAPPRTNWIKRSKDPKVEKMQEHLYKLGYLKTADDVDGYMGPKTRAAIEAHNAKELNYLIDGNKVHKVAVVYGQRRNKPQGMKVASNQTADLSQGSTSPRLGTPGDYNGSTDGTNGFYGYSMQIGGIRPVSQEEKNRFFERLSSSPGYDTSWLWGSLRNPAQANIAGHTSGSVYSSPVQDGYLAMPNGATESWNSQQESAAFGPLRTGYVTIPVESQPDPMRVQTTAVDHLGRHNQNPGNAVNGTSDYMINYLDELSNPNFYWLNQREY